MSSRFAVFGANTEQASPLARASIEALKAVGLSLTAGIEANADLEFILHLGDSDPPARLLPIPRLGVWRFACTTPGPLAFWDVYDDLYHMEIRLEKLTEREGWTIPLDRRWLRVDRCSYQRTTDAAIAEMAEMLVRAATVQPPTDATSVAFPPALPATPTAWHRANMFVKLAWRNARAQVMGILFREAWKVGVVDEPLSEFATQYFVPSIRWFPNPAANRFLADPFLEETRDGFVLTAEDFNFTTDRGRIVQWRSPDASFPSRPTAAIAENCHMSYPFLLRHDGELYCIPETHQQGAIFAWRRKENAWIDRREIFRAAGNPAPIDPTLVAHEGRWWLFCTNQHDGVNSKLHVYYADSPWGPWTPHACNPVKVDIRSSRPGGTPFIHRGELYRPAQDCSKHYGWRLMINRVTRLTPTEFAEEVIRVFDSDRLGVDGIHTLSGSGNLSVVDGRVERFDARRIPRILAHKLRRLTGTGATG